MALKPWNWIVWFWTEIIACAWREPFYWLSLFLAVVALSCLLLQANRRYFMPQILRPSMMESYINLTSTCLVSRRCGIERVLTSVRPSGRDASNVFPCLIIVFRNFLCWRWSSEWTSQLANKHFPVLSKFINPTGWQRQHKQSLQKEVLRKDAEQLTCNKRLIASRMYLEFNE